MAVCRVSGLPKWWRTSRYAQVRAVRLRGLLAGPALAQFLLDLREDLAADAPTHHLLFDLVGLLLQHRDPLVEFGGSRLEIA